MSFLRYLRRAAMLPAFFVCVLTAQQADLSAESQRAKQLMEAGRFEEAIPICKRLVQAMPGNTGLLLNLALAEHMAGHEREAIPNFEAVLRADPKSQPALLSLAAARLTLNDPQFAVAPLQKAVAAEPNNSEARGMLADALMESGRVDEAAAEYRKLTDAAPNDPRAWYGLGKAYEAIAERAFDRLQQSDPKSPYVAALIADTRVQTRQYRSAFFFYREALKQLPNLHGIHSAMADLYRKTGHADWAAEEDAKERALAPADCKVHRAECEFIGGHDVQAASAAATQPEALFWQAKAANELALQAYFRLGQLPPSVELHRLRAEIARSQRQPAEAVKELRAAVALAPRDFDLQQELAAALFMAQDYRGALQQTTMLLKAAPQSPELNLLAGDSLLHMEQPDKAVPYLRAALNNNPNFLPAHASLGLALMRIGQAAEALPHLERAQELDEDGSLHYQIGRAYQAAGQPEKARAAMAKYQEIVSRSEQAKKEFEAESQ